MKVTRQDALEASKGMLQKQFYVVFSTPTRGLGPVMENLQVHLQHQIRIERDGILVAAGPQGMLVIRAKSMAEAKAIAAADPDTIWADYGIASQTS